MQLGPQAMHELPNNSTGFLTSRLSSNYYLSIKVSTYWVYADAACVPILYSNAFRVIQYTYGSYFRFSMN